MAKQEITDSDLRADGEQRIEPSVPSSSGSYFNETRKPIYALLLTIPFLAGYELGILFGGLVGDHSINGGDWVVRAIFSNISSMHGATLSVLVMGAVFLFYSIRQGASWKWNGGTYALALAESLFWAVCLTVIAGLVNDLMRPASAGAPVSFNGPELGVFDRQISAALGRFQRLALFCGAGVFEELVFRVMLLLPLFWFIAWSDRVSKTRAFITASVIAALVFSAFHYRVFTGAGDPFNLTSFIFRFLAGLYFTAICYKRNFGIAVAAHAMYDIIVGM